MNLTETTITYQIPPLARFTNEHGHVYDVYQDHCAIDPRDNGDFMAPTYAPETDSRERSQASALFTLFDQIERDGYEGGAWGRAYDALPDYRIGTLVEFINHLNRAKDIAPSETLHVFREVGYSQGDVWDILVIETDDFPAPEASAKELAGYFRGDVYSVSCSCGESLSGIDGFDCDYDKVVEYFAEHYCDNPTMSEVD